MEIIPQMFWRVAYHMAKVEEKLGENPEMQARYFYDLLASKRFLPNSPTFIGAGTLLGQLVACFVLPISDDMGKKESGIFRTLLYASLIQQSGGGNGFSFSRLRPCGTFVKSSGGEATGSVGFLKVYDKDFGEVAQAGTRRGANVAVLRVDHPDIEEFIMCKSDEYALTNINISVGIIDKFMEAVEKAREWELLFPDISDPKYTIFDGSIDKAQELGIPINRFSSLKARHLWEMITI